MKAEISDSGRLYIERRGKMKLMVCKPYNGFCTDDCPMFEEPTQSGRISLCLKTLKFDSITDYRR